MVPEHSDASNPNHSWRHFSKQGHAEQAKGARLGLAHRYVRHHGPRGRIDQETNGFDIYAARRAGAPSGGACETCLREPKDGEAGGVYVPPELLASIRSVARALCAPLTRQ